MELWEIDDERIVILSKVTSREYVGDIEDVREVNTVASVIEIFDPRIRATYGERKSK